jgi:hypothetical protein
VRLSGEDLQFGDDPSSSESRHLKHTISNVLGNQALAAMKPRAKEQLRPLGFVPEKTNSAQSGVENHYLSYRNVFQATKGI